MLSILNQRGGNHNSCEDSVFVKETDTVIYGGVFDGCSSGENSHWASQTFAYVFKKYMEDFFGDLDYSVMLPAAKKLSTIAAMLNINTDTHLLSTCVLFYYNKAKKTLDVRCFGDGVFYVNDVEFIIDQGNIPDYLGYALKNATVENLLQYFDKYPILPFTDVDRFIICSDGIQAIHENQYEPASVKWEELLLAPPASENYLKRMWNILKNKKFTLSDDLTIVSYATT